jgi:hypothetical protein
VIEVYIKEAIRRGRITEEGESYPDFVQLVSLPKKALRITKWVIQTGRLRQFELASSLLYESVSIELCFYYRQRAESQSNSNIAGGFSPEAK